MYPLLSQLFQPLRILLISSVLQIFFGTYETFADAKLVEYMLGAMRGTISRALEAYKAEEHQLIASDTDPRIELFSQFINSPLRCRFEADFVAKNGDN